ncbi:MAG: hypothetical protein ACO2PM_03760 [Pyrobaculum sp.]
MNPLGFQSGYVSTLLEIQHENVAMSICPAGCNPLFQLFLRFNM